MIQFACPKCSFAFKSQPQEAGKKFNCPKCQQRVQVPPAAMSTVMGVVTPTAPAAPKPTPTPSVSAPSVTQASRRNPLTVWGIVAALLIIPAVVGLTVWYMTKQPGTTSPIAVASQEKKVVEPAPTQTVVPVAKVPVPTVAEEKPVPVVAEMSGAQLKAKCGPSVAFIETRFGRGSGFMLADNLVLTNSHVIRSDLVEHIHCSFPNSAHSGKKYDVQLLYEDRRRDIAVLRVNNTGVTPLKLVDQETPEGSDMFVIGSPGKGDGSVSSNAIVRGTLSNRTKLNPSPLDWYQTDAAINSGNSGGPFFNTRGEVIGIATLKSNNKVGMNYGVPWEEIHKAVAKAKAVRPEKVDEVGAIHDAFMISSKLVKHMALHRAGLINFAEAPDEPAREKAIDAVFERSKIAREELYQGISVELTRVTSNTVLGREYRDELSASWKQVNEIEKAFGDKNQLIELLKKSTAVSSKLQERVTAMIQLYGIDGID